MVNILINQWINSQKDKRESGDLLCCVHLWLQLIWNNLKHNFAYLCYKCFPAVSFHSHGKVKPGPGVVVVLQTRQDQVQVLPVHTALLSLRMTHISQLSRNQLHNEQIKAFRLNTEYKKIILSTLFLFMFITDSDEEGHNHTVAWDSIQGLATHLVADAEGHLGNLDVDERVVHSSPLLHFIDVIDRMLVRGGYKMLHLRERLRTVLCYSVVRRHCNVLHMVILQVWLRVFILLHNILCLFWVNTLMAFVHWHHSGWLDPFAFPLGIVPATFFFW